MNYKNNTSIAQKLDPNEIAKIEKACRQQRSEFLFEAVSVFFVLLTNGAHRLVKQTIKGNSTYTWPKSFGVTSR